MTEQIGVSAENLALLGRECGDQVHISDVIGDYDAELSIRSASAPYDTCTLIRLGDVNANHYTFLVDDLRAAENARVVNLRLGDPARLHRSQSRLIADNEKAKLIAINCSPRNTENIKDGANGPPFFLAITTSGVEVVSTLTTEPDSLGLLAEWNRVVALYKIIEQGHPIIHPGQQFRSKFAGIFREYPDFLEVVYQYDSVRELISAKEAGVHPEIIAVDPRAGSLVLEDIFGNLLIRQKDKREFTKLAVGSLATLEVTDGAKQVEIPIEVGTDLRSAPANKFVVYQSCDDTDDPNTSSALFELVVRVEDEKPRDSRKTAAYLLRDWVPDIDFSTASLVLRA